MSWKSRGGRPGKGYRRGVRKRKAEARRKRELEMCANSGSSKVARYRERQAAERDRQTRIQEERREAQRQADLDRSVRRSETRWAGLSTRWKF